MHCGLALSCVQSSVTFVRLNVIGHRWGGMFNCPASTCWLIDWALAHKQVRAFLGLVGYYGKIIKGFAKIAKPYTLLTRQQVKFEWTPEHHIAFLHLKETIVEGPILHYPKPDKRYIVYTDTSDDACRAQLSQNTMVQSSQ